MTAPLTPKTTIACYQAFCERRSHIYHVLKLLYCAFFVIGSMDLKTLITLTIMVSILVVSGYANEQNKPGKLHVLCGTTFIDVWKRICLSKAKKGG